MHNKNKTLDFYVKQAWHSIYKMYNAVGEEYGITQAEGLVLLNIPKEGIPVTQIGPEVGIESTSLSRMLNKLEKKGWIFRKIDAADKRKVKVYLTDIGVKKRNITKKVVREFDKIIKENIPENQLEKIMEGLQTITVLAEKYKEIKTEKIEI